MCNNMGFHGNNCNDGLRHIEQIALNKGAIDCLSGRVCRNEADIRDRYTKAELDRMLACKMDKCGLPRCQGNGKPNICDYYTKEELDDILAKIACNCDTYSKEELDDLLSKIACECDCYSKAEIDSLLENKANVGTPSTFELVVLPGFSCRQNSYYYKDQNNRVYVIGKVQKDSGDFINEERIAQLPEGFKPKNNLERPANYWPTLSGGILNIYEDGQIGVRIEGTNANCVWFEFSFIPDIE